MLTMMGCSIRAVFVISVGDNVNPRWLARGQRKVVTVNPIEVNGPHLLGVDVERGVVGSCEAGEGYTAGARPPALVHARE
jgi:hypothetical protein